VVLKSRLNFWATSPPSSNILPSPIWNNSPGILTEPKPIFPPVLQKSPNVLPLMKSGNRLIVPCEKYYQC
jgi:hypothetical protein